ATLVKYKNDPILKQHPELYDLLEDFLDHNEIPKGPIFLRDFGIHKSEQAIKYKTHKHNEVLRILLSYPNLKFILIGDSGEKDLDIYLEVARAFPNRIVAIYIRKVDDRKRNERIMVLAEKELEVPIFLFDNSFDAAKHAAKHRLISPGWLVKVKHSMDETPSLMDDWFDED
ncbi:MAG: phosphatase domain-containing protein, partial [Chitinophagales bacterium]